MIKLKKVIIQSLIQAVKNHITIFFFLVFVSGSTAQEQTVGLLSYNQDQAFDGYTLFFPRNQSTVFLIDNCGEIVHQWDDEDIYVPNNAVYLLANGNLVKCKKNFNGFTGVEGSGFFVEIRSWENELLWSYKSNSPEERIHHDIEILPNGNILMIAWEFRSKDEAIANGRLEETITSGELFPDYIFEINPSTNEKVWEWHVWDHLIQDVDSTKLNFGIVSEHPELVDINYVENVGANDWDWLHMNAIDYHAGLDQIMLCVPYFNEIWIIDHSTSTSEAFGHTGGNAGMGGDLLYRMGNPQSYKNGTEDDQILFFPHDTHWANEFLPADHPDYNKILVFNNRVEQNVSSMEIFENPWDVMESNYPTINRLFQPTFFENSITHPTPSSFYSAGLSSVQVLPNGNILGCSGGQGYLMELNPENEIVWEYKVPIKNGARVPQGVEIAYWENLTFRAFKYPKDFSAFDGKDLSQKGFIELNPNTTYCDSLTFTKEIVNDIEVNVFPNPASAELNITWSDREVKSIKIFNAIGREVLDVLPATNSETIDTSDFVKGVYVLIINNSKQQLFVVQ